MKLSTKILLITCVILAILGFISEIFRQVYLKKYGILVQKQVQKNISRVPNNKNNQNTKYETKYIRNAGNFKESTPEIIIKLINFTNDIPMIILGIIIILLTLLWFKTTLYPMILDDYEIPGGWIFGISFVVAWVVTMYILGFIIEYRTRRGLKANKKVIATFTGILVVTGGIGDAFSRGGHWSGSGPTKRRKKIKNKKNDFSESKKNKQKRNK